MRTNPTRAGAALIVMLIALHGCGGDSASSPGSGANSSTTSAGATTVAPTVTTMEATTSTSNTPAATTSTTSVEADDAELVAAGKLLFESTAGGVGCAACHGMDATGIPDLASPDVRGADFAMIADALINRAQMTTLVLSDDEIKAVVAFLATLDTDD